VIKNGVDKLIFNNSNFQPWLENEVLKIVTHHWSDNPMKGFDIYEQFEDFIDLQWSKKVIVVNISDFTKSSQRDMVRRKMGQEEEEGVPNDTQRSEKQKELMDKYGEGNNEPVIIIKTNKGYDLMEGWHRTMSILSLGSDGTNNYKKWRKVKIKAWIGE
jgi:hypothetical protein